MSENLSRKDKWRIESFNKIGEEIILGMVKITPEKCVGCTLCVRTCPAAALEIVEKKARMIQLIPLCMSCGDCSAICPENAIELTQYFQFKKFFRELDRGEPQKPRIF